mmetsp:Transcript_840/g.1434  ORF Transcript_840/g.1434 Transcript_840/m.1434 type:complete len:280 (-) Transcript_840:794-1633(-)
MASPWSPSFITTSSTATVRKVITRYKVSFCNNDRFWNRKLVLSIFEMRANCSSDLSSTIAFTSNVSSAIASKFSAISCRRALLITFRTGLLDLAASASEVIAPDTDAVRCIFFCIDDARGSLPAPLVVLPVAAAAETLLLPPPPPPPAAAGTGRISSKYKTIMVMSSVRSSYCSHSRYASLTTYFAASMGSLNFANISTTFCDVMNSKTPSDAITANLSSGEIAHSRISGSGHIPTFLPTWSPIDLEKAHPGFSSVLSHTLGGSPPSSNSSPNSVPKFS